MHSHDAKGLEDACHTSHVGTASRRDPLNSPTALRHHQQNRMTAFRVLEGEPGLPTSVSSRPLGKSKSELILQSGHRDRHVTFYPQDQSSGDAAGLPERRPFRPATMVRYQDEIGIPTVESNNSQWTRHQARMQAARLTNDSEEEYFVDGNFFFNHLVRHKEAEDYNMAEMLRERSRELQRRNVLGARFPRQGAGASTSLNPDRLSQSLPPLENNSSRRFYYSNNPEVQRVPPPSRPVKQEIPFAGGLEIEIPPRRHAGLGGGGLRQSMSQDRLLMVPSSHRNSAFFGKHYFKTAGNSGSGQNPTSRFIPSSYSATNFAPRSLLHSPAPDTDTSPVTKEFDIKSRILNPGIEPTTNRYNVRTGRLEPSRDFAPKLPPKLYNRQDPSLVPPFSHHRRAEFQSKPSDSPNYDLQRVQNVGRSPNISSHSPPNGWDHVSHNSHRQSPDQQQPKKSSSQLGYLSNAGHSNTVSPHPNSTIVSRKVVTWQDHVSPSHLTTPKSSPTESYPKEQHNISSRYEDRAPSPGDLAGVSFPLSDSLARNFVISDLHDVDQFALFEVSTSKLAWGEGFMGSDWLDKTEQYKFVMLNRNEEVLFVGVEEESSLSDCISSPHKSSFSVRILDANGRDVVHFRRLYSIKPKASFTSGNKTKYRLEVATPEGHVIGNVEKTYDSDNYYILEDRTGEFMFLVQRSCICTCPLFWDYEFKILLPESGTEIGEISWSYLTAQNEHFHGTEISFPMELNTISKVMLLGVCFLLNFSRWQSAYLDAIYNPWRRKENYKLCPWRSLSSENKELAALLRSSPEVDGFHRNEDVVDEDIELEVSPSNSEPNMTSNTSHVQ